MDLYGRPWNKRYKYCLFHGSHTLFVDFSDLYCRWSRFIYLGQRKRLCFRTHARVRLSVCLSVCVQDYSKTRAWIWMKSCVSTDVGTWTNWLTFEPDPGHSPDAGTGLLSPITYVLQRRILLRRENFTYWYSTPVEAATRGFEASKHRCRR